MLNNVSKVSKLEKGGKTLSRAVIVHFLYLRFSNTIIFFDDISKSFFFDKYFLVSILQL